MIYLKKFFESESLDEGEVKKMAKLIFDYFKEFEWNNTISEMEDLLKSNNEDDFYNEDDLTLEQIENAINNIFSSPFKRPRDKFDDLYNDIEIDSQHNVSLEEIEDLFLNSDFKYEIKKKFKSDTPIFEVNISSIPSDRVLSILSNIWNVVSKRLTNNYIINGISVDGHYKNNALFMITVTISGPKSSQDEDDMD